MRHVEMVVYYQDENVCIVSRDTFGSIPIYTEIGYSTAIPGTFNVCKEGLKSFNQQIEEGCRKAEARHVCREKIDPDHHNYIYFRAPYNGNVDVSTDFESLFEQLHGETRWSKDRIGLVTINVDPEKTYVFNSDARVTVGPNNINDEDTIQYGKNLLASSRIKLSDFLRGPKYDHEIVVKRPIIPPEWFSSCIIPGPTYKTDKMILNYAPGPGGEMIPTERKDILPSWKLPRTPIPERPRKSSTAPKKPKSVRIPKKPKNLTPKIVAALSPVDTEDVGNVAPVETEAVGNIAPIEPATPAAITRSGRVSRVPVRYGGGKTQRRHHKSRHNRKTRSKRG